MAWGVRAFETGVEGHLPVSGSARLEVDFSDATVDVDFADFNGGTAISHGRVCK